ncbi:hypothetical protein [Sulfolobus spindle-shaped virus]|nr:hypothetical protein [Sulfolobus spindle-shaped virus]AZG03167.1 hypothetical protein [Sulfolobus spindle-shaped virus]AZG03198.1 hypothetical protein [Sulfolobus spindle-shaped virus]AZG03235.1 hypothetical protein [Sulfolobus spindle-shaped virus]AZG03294.1 hypothetical protein [Sulfolobus spindle-shaped virus]
MLMDRLKVLWFIFILGNLFDYGATLLFSYLGVLYMDRNVFIGSNTSFLDVLITLTGEKLLLLSGVYWFTKLFDYLKISKYKWMGLLPFAIITILIVCILVIAILLFYLTS